MESYYTVDQISTMLDIHQKTIQRYIREGRLRASKIGKGWRVSGHDLSAFIELSGAGAPRSETDARRATQASSVIDIMTDRREDAIRIMNTLTAVQNSKPAEYGQATMQSQYIEHENMVRVTLWGGVRFMAVMMDAIASLTEPEDGSDRL